MGGERVIALEKAVTMRPLDHFHAHLVARRLQQAAGAAIGVGDEDMVILGAVFGDGCTHGLCYFLRIKMQVRGQAGERQVLPCVYLDQGEDFAGQRAAGDDENLTATLGREAFGGQRLIGRQGDHLSLGGRRITRRAT